MKTAMQELMDYLNEDEFGGICEIRDKVEELLEKEKEQIMKSYKDHHDLGHIYGLDTEEYYYDIYKSSIKKITITELNKNK